MSSSGDRYDSRYNHPNALLVSHTPKRIQHHHTANKYRLLCLAGSMSQRSLAVFPAVFLTPTDNHKRHRHINLRREIVYRLYVSFYAFAVRFVNDAKRAPFLYKRRYSHACRMRTRSSSASPPSRRR